MWLIVIFDILVFKYKIIAEFDQEEDARIYERKLISGMLLYAKTDDIIQPDNEYYMSGNKISVRTLDLNCDFTEIKRQLNEIVEEHFEVTATA